MTEPCSTGLGGDSFCLFYNGKTREVRGLNGSGRSAANLTLDLLESKGYGEHNHIPLHHACNVTVPGAAAAWIDTVTTFGSNRVTLSEILQPAIDLATYGFPVSMIAAYHWCEGEEGLLAEGNPHGRTLLLDTRAPQAGEVMRMPMLASTMKVQFEWFVCWSSCGDLGNTSTNKGKANSPSCTVSIS